MERHDGGREETKRLLATRLGHAVQHNSPVAVQIPDDVVDKLLLLAPLHELQKGAKQRTEDGGFICIPTAGHYRYNGALGVMRVEFVGVLFPGRRFGK